MGILDYPLVVFAISFLAMWLATRAGAILSARRRPLEHEEQEYFTIVLTAALTLLGLIIGFTFSLAASRYDLRKHYEEDEANAIGTEYLRVDLFPADESSRIRDLLRKYLALRILYYTASNLDPRSMRQLRQVNADTAQIQSQLWSLVENASVPHGTATMALVAAGMNDVINSQGYTQAAWWNRVPPAAWLLLWIIAVSCSYLIGFGEWRVRPILLLVLPILIAVSFLLIADIDSPRGGIIRVSPQNLLSVAHSIAPQRVPAP